MTGEQTRSRAERAFDRHLSRGKYPDGSPVREEHRTGFVRGWNMAHRKFTNAKKAALERRQAAIDKARAVGGE
jgi:hypothetical protein